MKEMKQARWKQKLYLTAGFVSVGLGVAGIPLPLLPTTPFLLLAAFCFARGSERWHNWLMNHRILSPYIHAFRKRTGLTREQKWRIAATVTVTLLITAVLTPVWMGRALAAFIWVTSILFVYFSPSARESQDSDDPA